MIDLYWAETTATWQRQGKMLPFWRYPNYVNYIQDLLGAQGLKLSLSLVVVIVIVLVV